MRSPLEQYFNDFEEILVITILLLVSTAFWFFILTFIKRVKKIRESEEKIIYQKEIDKILFDFLFLDKMEQAKDDGSHLDLKNKPALYKKVFLKSLSELHSNYSGIYSEKLEDLYVSSGLVNYSLNKLKSNYWANVIVGLRDLSTLQYQPLYDIINDIESKDYPQVQQEILLAKIRLRGLEELLNYMDSTLYLNDWTQSNILFEVKKHNIQATDALPRLLSSSNPSLVLLAVRLMNYFREADYQSLLLQLANETMDEKLKKELSFILANESTVLNK